MNTILFSLPVHERPDIVRDQILNIKKFCPDAIICIHVSKLVEAEKYEFEKQCDFDDVYINDVSYETRHGKGLLNIHVANYEYAAKRNVKADKIAFLSSNELLIKPGLSTFTSSYVLGSQTEIYQDSADWHLFRPQVRDDQRVQNFLKLLELPVYFGGQAEGQFFNVDIFEKIAELYKACFGMGIAGFETEEIIPSTFAARLCISGSRSALPITLCDYCSNISINEQLINYVRAGSGSIYGLKVPRALRSPHIGSFVMDNIFSVKRVPRTECELRTFIRDLPLD